MIYSNIHQRLELFRLICTQRRIVYFRAHFIHLSIIAMHFHERFSRNIVRTIFPAIAGFDISTKTPPFRVHRNSVSLKSFVSAFLEPAHERLERFLREVLFVSRIGSSDAESLFYPFSPSECAASVTPPLFALSQANTRRLAPACTNAARPLAGCPAIRADIDTERQRKKYHDSVSHSYGDGNEQTQQRRAWWRKKSGKVSGQVTEASDGWSCIHAMWMDAGKSASTHLHICSCDKNWLALAGDARARVWDLRKSRSFLSSRRSEWRGECRRMGNTFALPLRRVRKSEEEKTVRKIFDFPRTRPLATYSEQLFLFADIVVLL